MDDFQGMYGDQYSPDMNLLLSGDPYSVGHGRALGLRTHNLYPGYGNSTGQYGKVEDVHQLNQQGVSAGLGFANKLPYHYLEPREASQRMGIVPANIPMRASHLNGKGQCSGLVTDGTDGRPLHSIVNNYYVSDSPPVGSLAKSGPPKASVKLAVGGSKKESMKNLDDGIDQNTLLMFFIFIVLVFISYYFISSVNELKSQLENIKNTLMLKV